MSAPKVSLVLYYNNCCLLEALITDTFLPTLPPPPFPMQATLPDRVPRGRWHVDSVGDSGTDDSTRAGQDRVHTIALRHR